MLDRFLRELKEWNQNGKEPQDANIDVRYDLDQREKRVKAAGLSVEEEFAPVKDEIRGVLARRGTVYSTNVVYKETRHTVHYEKDGKTLYNSVKPENIYVSVINRNADHTEDFPYTCPNCGHLTMAGKLQEGCPYCGTRFELTDLYPKINGYYTVPGIVERANLMDNIKRRCLIAGIVCGIAGFLMMFVTHSDYQLWFRIVISLFFSGLVGGMGALMAYFAQSLGLLGKVVYEAGRSVPLLSGLGSKKKMTEFMKAYDPDFSFELFEGKVIAKLRAIAFADSRKDLTVWEGSEDLSMFDNLVDMRYRGSLDVRKIERRNHKIAATVKAYVTDLYYTGRIKAKDETIYATLEIDEDALEDPGFSVHAVTCRSCGASFDAMHRKTCPSCGNAYKLIHEDWVVTSVHK